MFSFIYIFKGINQKTILFFLYVNIIMITDKKLNVLNTVTFILRKHGFISENF